MSFSSQGSQAEEAGEVLNVAVYVYERHVSGHCVSGGLQEQVEAVNVPGLVQNLLFQKVVSRSLYSCNTPFFNRMLSSMCCDTCTKNSMQ